MQTLIVGNWKMHGSSAMAQELVQASMCAGAKAPQHVQVVLCPPSVLLAQVAQQAQATPTAIGAQDCHAETSGAYTGDISAAMIKDAGASYVIVGHSERRAGHGESSALVAKKASAALSAGLIPIICIGETLAEREGGKAEAVVSEQIRDSVPQAAQSGNFVLAYEPVWAIGSGKTPSLDDIAQMHAHIQAVAASQVGMEKDRVAVLYGGSVKPDNAAAILALEGVSGVLVGGASVKAEEFCKIIEAA